MHSSNKIHILRVFSRSSPLARIQVQEILEELKLHHPDIQFDHHTVKTLGDRDLLTSLRSLEKTDFFTKEIDEALLNGEARLGIHSAKDLPSPLPAGLALICLTKGVDPSDSLVLRPGVTLDHLPPQARIGTSSVRREECLKQLRDDLTFIDVRGTIGQRIHLLDNYEVDGVVIAEAALIRLGLTDLNRMILPGSTVEGQGQLAVIALADDEEMKALFKPMDVRQ